MYATSRYNGAQTISVGSPVRQAQRQPAMDRDHPIDLSSVGNQGEDGTMGRVTAIFDDRVQAEMAIGELRRRGIPDAKLSVVSRRPDDVDVTKVHHEDTKGERIGKGAITGAGVGVLFGLAAAVIPGVGPFITAGVLASALGTAGGAAAAGAIVGGTAGTLASLFANAGYSKEEAEFYGPAVERGAVLVAVESDDISSAELRAEHIRLGGRVFGGTADRPLVEVRTNS